MAGGLSRPRSGEDQGQMQARACRLQIPGSSHTRPLAEGGEAHGHQAGNPWPWLHRQQSSALRQGTPGALRGRGLVGRASRCRLQAPGAGACADRACVFAALSLGWMLHLKSPRHAGRADTDLCSYFLWCQPLKRLFSCFC